MTLPVPHDLPHVRSSAASSTDAEFFLDGDPATAISIAYSVSNVSAVEFHPRDDRACRS